MAEADAVKSGAHLLYETNTYGITILTDTTERSPTFSLRPFENSFDPPETKPALAYLCLPETRTAEEAWNKILGRLPIGLEWPELQSRLGQKVALGFDFSLHARKRRQESTQHSLGFKIFQDTGGIAFSLAGQEHFLAADFSSAERGFFFQHLLLKLVLNTHSLLLMGRLGRYEKNVMTWVRPSNGKLIDRSIRYVQYLLEAQGKRPSYEEIARHIFSVYSAVGDDEPVVLRVVERFMAK